MLKEIFQALHSGQRSKDCKQQLFCILYRPIHRHYHDHHHQILVWVLKVGDQSYNLKAGAWWPFMSTKFFGDWLISTANGDSLYSLVNEMLQHKQCALVFPVLMKAFRIHNNAIKRREFISSYNAVFIGKHTWLQKTEDLVYDCILVFCNGHLLHLLQKIFSRNILSSSATL